jgi:NAD(P)-dependent dehydrogenase (short-subunit alcohol dehydrogenase family)
MRLADNDRDRPENPSQGHPVEAYSVCRLDGKVALITGAGAGIGQATASLFAQQGAKVVIFDRDQSSSEASADSICSAGGTAIATHGDVRDARCIDRVVARVNAELGGIHILVNNAGIFPRAALADISDDQWDEVLDINLKGVFHCARAVAPQMIERRAGKIINISSVNIHVGATNFSHYIASKGGVIGFTRALARELGDHNIHVNAVTPGAVQTESERRIVEAQGKAGEEAVAGIVARQCLKRRVLPAEIASVCLFLASDLSNSMTGQTLNADCGYALY